MLPVRASQHGNLKGIQRDPAEGMQNEMEIAVFPRHGEFPERICDFAASRTAFRRDPGWFPAVDDPAPFPFLRRIIRGRVFEHARPFPDAFSRTQNPIGERDFPHGRRGEFQFAVSREGEGYRYGFRRDRRKELQASDGDFPCFSGWLKIEGPHRFAARRAHGFPIPVKYDCDTQRLVMKAVDLSVCAIGEAQRVGRQLPDCDFSRCADRAATLVFCLNRNFSFCNGTLRRERGSAPELPCCAFFVKTRQDSALLAWRGAARGDAAECAGT